MKIYTYVIELEREWFDDWDCSIKITSIKKVPLDVFQEMIKEIIKELRDDDDDAYIAPHNIADKLYNKYPEWFIAPDIDYEHAYTLCIDGKEQNELALYTNKEWITTYNVKE